MRGNFRLNLALAFSGIIIFSIAAGMLWAKEAPGYLVALSAIGMLLSLLYACRMFSELTGQIRTFVKSIEMKDFTIKFPKSKDKCIDELHESMNRIIALNRDGTLALETRKLYYDRILRIMTHELRNGIAPIVSLSTDMERNPERYAGDKLKEAVSLINEEATSIKKFLDSYYELTHLPRPEIKEIQASAFFNSIAESARLMAAEHGISEDAVSVSVAKDMMLRMDPDLMRRVMFNIVDNAFYFARDREEPRIEITVSEPEGHPFIRISDNGCGMDSATLENLFQPFFTTKPEGNGIGLCLSRHIVRLHGGDISVSSAKGRGTSFYITLDGNC